MSIIKRLWQIREEKGLTRKEIAAKIFMSPENYQAIEYERSRLSLETYLSICKALEISPMELLKENDDEHFILLNKKDLSDLSRIFEKINNQIIDNSKYEYLNQSNNIQIGDHNSINNSFNKK